MKLCKISLIVFLIMCVHVTGFSQRSTKTLISQIQKNIIALDKYHYRNSTIDPDSLSLATANKLVNLLKRKQLSKTEVEKLGLELSIKTIDSSNIRIYSFKYNCGGSAGYIWHPVMQWTNKTGKLFAYNFSKYVNCNFDEINRLSSTSKNLYLLIGSTRGNGACMASCIYTIQIKGDYLILDYAAFVTAPYLWFCNTEINFDSKKQRLKITFERREDMYSYDTDSKYLKSEKSIQKLRSWFIQEEWWTVDLKFNGTRFRKIQ